MAFLSLRERFWNRFTGKEVNMTPVGTTNTYGVVALMKQCGYERPLADRESGCIDRTWLFRTQVCGL